MADNIVARLRKVPTSTADNCEELSLITEEAADEIERLCAAGDALAEALHGWCNGMDAFTDDWERLRVWQEARRG